MLNWFTGRQKSNLPEPTALQTQRSRQIEQLKSFNQNVSEIQRDVEYRVNTIISGATVSLYITLPPLFPQDKPVVKVSPRVHHSWVNDQMIITGSPSINSFMIHSDLGKAIREVVDEFQRHPPTMLPQQYGFGFGSYPGSTGSGPGGGASVPPPTLPPSGGSFPRPAPYPIHAPPYMPNSTPSYIPPMPAAPTLGPTDTSVSSSSSSSVFPHSSSSSSVISQPQVYSSPSGNNLGGMVYPQNDASPASLPAVGKYGMPVVPSGVPQLMDLTHQELQELSEDEEKMMQILGNMPELQQMNIDKEKLIDENEQLANQNLSLKPLMEEKKKNLLERYDQLNEVRRRFDEHSCRQDVLRQQCDPREIQEKLRKAARQAEEASDAVAERFLEGQIGVDEFKKTYMDKRKLHHLRRAKDERLSVCILNQSPVRNF